MAVKSKGRKAKPGTVSDRFRKLRAFTSAGESLLTQQVGPSAGLLWLTLWAYEDAKSGTVSIGRDSLVRITGMSEPSIKRLTKSLLDFGYLERIRPGIVGKTASVYILNPLPISRPKGGSPTTPEQKARGIAGDLKGGSPAIPIQSPTETVSGADHSVRRPRHVVPLPAPGMPAPKCSAPERESPEEFVRELLRAAGGTLPVATINGAADKPGGPGFRAIENLMIRHPRFKYSIDPKTNKGLLTLIEDKPQ